MLSRDYEHNTFSSNMSFEIKANDYLWGYYNDRFIVFTAILFS